LFQKDTTNREGNLFDGHTDYFHIRKFNLNGYTSMKT
jgi:hypothetical protein